MAGEKMKKIKEAFRKLREKGKSIGINSCKILVLLQFETIEWYLSVILYTLDTFKTSTKVEASGWIPPSEANENLSNRGVLPCGNSALMEVNIKWNNVKGFNSSKIP